MREIKFRAWDGRRKRMMQPFITFGKHPADGLIYENINWYDDEDMDRGWDKSNQVNELMQFTGLKDKNGKEIYESDVVKVTGPWDDENDNYKIVEIEFDDSGGWVILWDSGFNSGDSDMTLIGWAIYQDYTFEVIGNIYENEDLLKL